MKLEEALNKCKFMKDYILELFEKYPNDYFDTQELVHTLNRDYKTNFASKTVHGATMGMDKKYKYFVNNCKNLYGHPDAIKKLEKRRVM